MFESFSLYCDDQMVSKRGDVTGMNTYRGLERIMVFSARSACRYFLDRRAMLFVSIPSPLVRSMRT